MASGVQILAQSLGRRRGLLRQERPVGIASEAAATHNNTVRPLCKLKSREGNAAARRTHHPFELQHADGLTLLAIGFAQVMQQIHAASCSPAGTQ